MPLKKPQGNKLSGRQSVDMTLTGRLLEHYPTLLEFLTQSTWEDGSSRPPGTLLLFTDGCMWKICLKDKTGPRVCFASSTELDLLFLTVEEGLKDDSLDWRADRPQQGRR